MPWTPLVGHQRTLDPLRAALARGRLAHGWLFVGPEGIGKRRAARHVAQGLLCETRPHAELNPCGRCPSCRQLEIDSHPDLMEVGRPEDRHEFPIDVIHEVTARLGVKSARGGWKVAIIDDADSFNEESANSLLKTLEEPPPKSLLILISTAAETQLDTITSRCQLLRFQPLADDEVARLLIETGVTSDPDDARRIASQAAGSIGAATELAAPEIREFRDEFRRGLSAPTIATVPLTARAIELIESAGKESAAKRRRAGRVIGFAAELFRQALLVRVSGRLDGDPADLTQAATLAARLDEETLIDLAERSIQADFQVQRFLHLQLTIETWIDELAQLAAGEMIPAAR